MAWSSAPARGQQSQLRLALKGYDPVAYFTDGKPTRGTPEFAQDWDGARYHFASRAHRDAFAADPDKYAPQYSGHCAGAMSKGVKIEADPENWTISDGRLFVFASAESAPRWTAVRAEAIANADRQWSALKKTEN